MTAGSSYAPPSKTDTGRRLAEATTDAWSAGVTGDTVDRFIIDADGTEFFGSGNALDAGGGMPKPHQKRMSDGVLRSGFTQEIIDAEFRLVQGGAGNAVTINVAGITFLDGKNVIAGTSTGTKWGTAVTQKQAWWGTTPVVQPSGVADPAGGLTIDLEARTAIIAVITKLESIGLLATV